MFCSSVLLGSFKESCALSILLCLEIRFIFLKTVNRLDLSSSTSTFPFKQILNCLLWYKSLLNHYPNHFLFLLYCLEYCSSRLLFSTLPYCVVFTLFLDSSSFSYFECLRFCHYSTVEFRFPFHILQDSIYCNQPFSQLSIHRKDYC